MAEKGGDTFGAAFAPRTFYDAPRPPTATMPSRVVLEPRPVYTESIVRPVDEGRIVLPAYQREVAVAPYQPRYAQPVQELVQIQYVEKPEPPPESFGEEAWREVIRPLGMGIVAPVGGACAFVGGCCYGAFSICKGILGTVPLAIDYAVKPAVGGVAYVVDGTDDGIKYTLGYRNETLVRSDFVGPDGRVHDQEHYIDVDRRIIERAKQTQFGATPIPLADQPDGRKIYDRVDPQTGRVYYDTIEPRTVYVPPTSGYAPARFESRTYSNSRIEYASAYRPTAV